MWRFAASIVLLAALFCLAPRAHAQNVNMNCLTGTSSTGNPTWAPASSSNPCPVAIYQGAGGVAYGSVDTASAGTTSGTLFTAGQFTKFLQICTQIGSTANVFLNVHGGAAVVNAGIPIKGGGGCVNFGTAALPIPSGAIAAITDGGSPQSLLVAGL